MANTTTQGVALIYVRKSMVRSKADEQSPTRQRAICTQEVERREWIPEVYEDAGGHRSGRSEKHRPAFRRLKTQLGRPEVKAIVVSALDRLSRSPRDFFNFLSLLQKHDVELISLQEQFDTSTAIGKAFVSMIMIVAALEADITSERTSAAIEFRRNQGIHVGNAPFGLSRNEEGALEPNEDAQAARFVLQTYAQGDHSFQAVADHVNATLFRFRDRGKNRVPFTKCSTRSIVSNVLVYVGFIPTTRSTEMSMPNGLDDSRSLIDQMTAIYQGVEGKVTPIITRDLAERVLSARFKRRYLGAKRGRYLYILTPILFCHHCGEEMRGQLSRDKPWYKHLKKSCTPGQGQHSAEELEKKALSLFRGLSLPPGLENLIREKVRERQEKQPENTEVRKTTERLQGKMARLQELYLEGDITRQEYATRKTALQTQIDQWITKLGPADYNIAGVFDELSNLAETLQRGTPGQQKRVINAVFERIEVGLDGEMKRAEPRPWFAPLFVDLAAALSGDIIYPQGTLGTQYVARILTLMAIIPRHLRLSK